MCINIRIMYITFNSNHLYNLFFSKPVALIEAINESNIFIDFSCVEIYRQSVGIYSKVVSLHYCIKHNDRIEIYKDLVIEAKNARSIRAKKKYSF